MSYAAVPPSPKKAAPPASASASTSASSRLLEDGDADGWPKDDDADVYEGGSATVFSAVSK